MITKPLARCAKLRQAGLPTRFRFFGLPKVLPRNRRAVGAKDRRLSRYVQWRAREKTMDEPYGGGPAPDFHGIPSYGAARTRDPRQRTCIAGSYPPNPILSTWDAFRKANDFIRPGRDQHFSRTNSLRAAPRFFRRGFQRAVHFLLRAPSDPVFCGSVSAVPFIMRGSLLLAKAGIRALLIILFCDMATQYPAMPRSAATLPGKKQGNANVADKYPAGIRHK